MRPRGASSYVQVELGTMLHNQGQARRFRFPLWAALVTALVACASAYGAQRWFDERTAGPFQIHADHSLTADGRLPESLLALQSDLVRQLDIPPPREPIHLFLFQRRNVYDAYMREYFPRVPQRRAMYIRERGPGMVFAYRSEELSTDLSHETTHALLHAACVSVPLWLDEGLAEYFEIAPAKRAGDNPYLGTVKWHARWGWATKLEDLEAINEPARMGQAEYRQAWAWVHFLLHGPREGRAELVQYLADLRTEAAPLRLSVRLRRLWPDLDQQFVQHFRTWQP